MKPTTKIKLQNNQNEQTNRLCVTFDFSLKEIDRVVVQRH